MAKKSAWGWTSTVLAIAAMFIPGGQWAGIKLIAIAAAVGAGYQESKYQQRQAMKAFKKAFGAIGDSALAGSPTYSWDGPQTVADVSLPVPLCYGQVTVGGNIVNAWTDTVNIYATKWEVITPTKIEEPWGDYENIIRTDNLSRGVRIEFHEHTITGELPSGKKTVHRVKYNIFYRITGASTWILLHSQYGSGMKLDKRYVITIIDPSGNLYNKQYDIKTVIANHTQTRGKQHYKTIYSAHENMQDTENVAGHKDIQYLAIALSEGEIQSIDEGSIKLDNNSLSNYGRDHYQFDYILGSNQQVANPIFDAIVTQNSVAYKALYNDLSPLIVTTQNLDVNAIMLVLSFPSGIYQITDGKFAAWQVDLTVSYRKVGDSTWIPKDKIIRIKNNNPFKQSIKLDNIAEGRYEVKIVKTSVDPDGIITIGDVWWIGLQEYVSEPQNYPNTAIAYLTLQANEQSSGTIPNILFNINGKLIDVPKLTISSVTVPYYLTYWNGTNYVLDGEWNGYAIDTICTDTGLFVSQWTDNPIWCLRDLINNDHYGLKSYFQSTLNDIDLRLLAKYCDTKVDDGSEGTEKRFQLDIVIDSQDDARNVIERILSTFRGFAVWAENQFKIKINKAENPVQLFTMGNIIENSLSINYTSATDRFNVAKITYPDRNDTNARLSEVMIYDVPLGGMERAQTFNLIGITRRSQAVRMGRFFLNQAKYIKESIQFKAGLDAIACEAGDVIDFSHDVLAYGLASGRIKASTINSITIDTPISIDTQKTYKVRVMLTDDTIEERTVHNTNSTPPYSLVMTSNFTSVPPVDGIYTFGESGSVTKPYRILSINRDSIQERQITAIEDNASIYSDTGDAVETINYSSLKNPLQIPNSVTDLSVKELTVDPGDGTKINTILISWNPPTIISNPSILPIVTTATTGGSIAAGTYYCKYSWVGAGGETLASSYTSIVTTGSTSTITIQIPSLTIDATSANVYVGTTMGQEKYQGQITASYGTIVLTTIPLTGNAIPITNSTQNASEYDRAKIYLSDSAGAFWEYKGEAKSSFIIENLNKLTYKIAVVSVSLYGIAQSITDAATADITVGGDTIPPANTTFIDANILTTNDSTYLTNSPEANIYTTNDDWNYSYGIKLRWNPVTDADLSGYEIRIENANWGVNNGYFVYRGKNTSYIFENVQAASYTFYVKAYDTSGNYSATAGAIAIGNSAPSLGDIYTDFTGKDCMLWWPECQDEDFKEYQIYVYSDSGRTELVHYDRVSDPIYNFTYEMNIQKFGSMGSRTLYFTIKAVDMLGQEGSKDVIAMNLAPAAPTGLTSFNGYGIVFIEWNEASDPDFRGYNVYIDNIKTAFTTSPSYGHLGTTWTEYDYYIKAVDTFGEGNQSLTIQGTPQGSLLDTVAPVTPTGLSATSASSVASDGTVITSIIASWTANTETDLSYYEVRIKEASGNYVYFNAPNNNYTFSPVKAGITYYVNVLAVDSSGNKSGWVASDYTIVAAADATIPSAPSVLTAIGGFSYIALKWTNPTDTDFQGVEIWRADSNDRAFAAKIAEVRTTWYHDKVGNEVTRYYWIRAKDWSGNLSDWHPSSATAGVSATTVLVTSTDVITVSALITTSAQIDDAIITNAHIITLNATKLDAGDIATARLQVNAAAAVNAGTVQINPGQILVSGSTTLSDWRHGTDATKIDGGDIYANSITANKLAIGSRNVSITGLTFTANSPSTNYIAWTTGTISYTKDDGTVASVTITASNIGWTTGIIYIYWAKDATVLSTVVETGDGVGRGVAHGANNIVLATYAGGTSTVVTYGRTTIDGNFIKTGTIEATHLVATNLGAIFADLGTVTTGLIQANNPTWNYWNLSTGVFSLGKSTAAHFKINADGSGFLGNNKVTWDAAGSITFSGMLGAGTSGYSNISDKPTLGAMALEDLVTLAKLDSTIIVGGYIKTSLLTADNIQVGTLVGRTIKTQASGERIELTADKKEARWYNSSGVVISSIGVESGDDQSFYDIEHTPSGTPSVYVGMYSNIAATNRTIATQVTYGIIGQTSDIQNDTIGFGVVGDSTKNVSATTSLSIGLWGVGSEYDLALGSGYIARINGYAGYITLADTNSTPIERKIPSGVFGSVTGGTSPSVKRGTGFSVSYVSAGKYTVTFDNAFSVIPVITATPFQASGAGDYTVTVTAESASAFTVILFATNGSAVNQDFNFSAIVP